MKYVSNFSRSQFTDFLLEEINKVLLCGDHEAPREGGWDGPPEDLDSSYHPYVVLGAGTIGEASGPLGDSQADVRAPYIITSYGPNRRIAEESSEIARAVLLDLARTIVVLDGANWKVQQVRTSTIGAVVRNDSAETAKFSEVDTLTVWLSKELGNG